MIQFYMICPYCSHTKLYSLQNEYKKCPQCNKKFSVNKLNLDKKCMEYFCNNINANEASKKLNKNYRSIQNRYTVFRKLIALYLENLYNSSLKDNSLYEEYFYIPLRAKKNKVTLDKTINIIGFYSNSKVYTLLMPKLPSYDNDVDNINFETYLSRNKINSLSSYTTPLNVFWKYLDENLKKYKGVNEKNFFLYLKECEFKYNFLQNQQINILQKIYYSNIR